MKDVIQLIHGHLEIVKYDWSWLEMIAQGEAEGYGQFQTHVVNSMEIVGRT